MISRPPPVIAAASSGGSRDESAGERLAKRLAHQLPCSRSEAERYIEAGHVTVDGVVVTSPQFRVLAQKVALSADASLAPVVAVTLLLNKPPGVDASGTAADVLPYLVPSNRFASDVSGIAVLARHFANQRCLVPLDTASGGLLVFSQDPRIERKLRDDIHVIEHESMVDIAGQVTPEAIVSIERAATQVPRATASAKVSISSQSDTATRLRLATKGLQPGWIAQACEAAGLQVAAIRRTRIGRVPLAGLPSGQWRFLDESERF
jgi:23S rRNA pseudouridine2604 synthase